MPTRAGVVRRATCDVLIFVEEAAEAVTSLDLVDPDRYTVGEWL
jgi:hypothetical protein